MEPIALDYAALDRYQAVRSAQATPRGPSADDSAERLQEVASEFEALFVKQMLNSMRSSLDQENDMLHGGFAQEVFEDMLYDQYAKIMAKAGDFGIARLIVDRYGTPETEP